MGKPKCPAKDSSGKPCSKYAGHNGKDIVCKVHVFNHAGSSKNTWAARNDWSVKDLDDDGNTIVLRS
eukprot:scaffold75760_cov60-Cyclotella_meneghiniana.AAC.15